MKLKYPNAADYMAVGLIKLSKYAVMYSIVLFSVMHI